MFQPGFPWRNRPAALVIAHPGHELRVHHWMELARPLVFVLTDGSGHTGRSRLASTTRILDAAGARTGPICGRFTDAEIYAAMLQGRRNLIADLLHELARSLVEEGIEYVAHDAVEGYNPSHDLCWHLAGAAALLAGKISGREIYAFDFLLTGRPDECPEEMQADALRIALDDAALSRKLAAAESYGELKEEVDAALRKFGKAPFALEWLRPARGTATRIEEAGEIPFYENYGEAQKAAGHYADVIRRREHLLPLQRMLWEIAGRG